MKGIRKTPNNIRKRVISVLLSALMVLSIVMPGGSGQVRYNAYAEGEESGYESVSASDVTGEVSEENTEETTFENTSEEAENIDEYTSEDITAEDTTERIEDDNTVAETSNTTETTLENDETINGIVNQTMGLVGSSFDDELIITPENDVLVGDGEYINPTNIFLISYIGQLIKYSTKVL